ncbi:MAG: hypothetical protein IT324_27935, partial [Anaerolineae bacterium]|nr:hypothetical protein [Anaerolineae bacterium]
ITGINPLFVRHWFSLLLGHLMGWLTLSVPSRSFFDSLYQMASQYEVLYDERYREEWWENSKLLSLITYFFWSRVPESDVFLYKKGTYPPALASAIIDRFAGDVMKEGSEFVVVHLPTRGYLENEVDGVSPPYEYILNDIAPKYRLIRPELAFHDKGNQYWMPGTHYSVAANQIVAQYIAGQIAPLLKDQVSKPQ